MNNEQIRKRFERAKEHVKTDPWYVSTNVYIADVGELLDEVERWQKLYESMERTWQKAEQHLTATQKQLEAAVEDLKDSIYNPYGCVYCKHQRIDSDTFYCDLECDDEHNRFEWRGERSE